MEFETLPFHCDGRNSPGKSTFVRFAARRLAMFFATLAVAAALDATDLSWNELALRPELWPSQCTATATIIGHGGPGIQAGDKLSVVQLTADNIEVVGPDGRAHLALPPGMTDALAVARQSYAALTPKQQQLSYEVLEQHSELWPLHVTLLNMVSLGGGKALRGGEQVRLVGLSHGVVTLLAGGQSSTIEVSAAMTDLMAQARKFAEDEHAGPRFVPADIHIDPAVQKYGQLIASFEDKLVNSVTGEAEPIDAAAVPHYIVLFRGSSKDPFTRGFTPTLLKYYKETKPRHPDFEVIYLMAEPVAETAKFAKKVGFSWRALTDETVASLPIVADTLSGQLPQLTVCDRKGDVLLSGSQADALTALRHFDSLLQLQR